MFRRVTVPTSLPGLVVGSTPVFVLTASSYVTPAILGGSKGAMPGMLIQEQVVAVLDGPFGSAIATVMVATVPPVNLLGVAALGARRRVRAGAA